MVARNAMREGHFRMGWILAMFDLPVLTKPQRQVASRFRARLRNDGYVMIQFSVYARPCVTLEQMETHVAHVRKFAPHTGNVRLLFMTDQQWGNSQTILGEHDVQGKRETEPRMPRQIEFWE